MDRKILAVRKKWVAALRSGEYAQGTGELLTIQSDGQEEYCCLGVLCDLVDPDGWEQNNLTDHSSSCFYDGKEGAPPDWISYLAGLDDDSVTALIKLNDVHQYDFTEIADTIETAGDGPIRT